MYQPDAKTLIRHAMQALDDELGVNDAWPYVKRLQAIFWDLRKREEDAAKAKSLELAGSVFSRPRFAVVNHAEDMNHGLRLVKSGEGPEAA